MRPLPGDHPYPVGDLEILHWPEIQKDGLEAFLTTRSVGDQPGGVSARSYASLNLGLHVGDDPANVLENRSRVARAVGVDLDDFVFCNQIHRPNVVVVTEEHRGRGARSTADALPDTDAMVTTTPGLVLAVMVADCVPLVLHDPVAGVLGCVHAGWGGTVRGVTPAAVSVMRQLGAEPGRIRAGLGAAISAADYQVGDDVKTAAEAAFGDRVDQVIRPDGTGRWLFDLIRSNELQLLASGVPRTQIYTSGLVTGPGTQFFSHRADGPCGRFAAIARLTTVGQR